jgi:hypothetical protein
MCFCTTAVVAAAAVAHCLKLLQLQLMSRYLDVGVANDVAFVV